MGSQMGATCSYSAMPSAPRLSTACLRGHTSQVLVEEATTTQLSRYCAAPAAGKRALTAKESTYVTSAGRWDMIHMSCERHVTHYNYVPLLTSKDRHSKQFKK